MKEPPAMLQQDGGRRLSLAIMAAFLVAITVYWGSGKTSYAPAGSDALPCPLETVDASNCLLELSEGRWELATDGCPEPRPGVLRACEEIRTPYPRQWVWGRGGNAAACVPRELRYGNVKKLFAGKRIALAGDSHLRKLWAYMWTFLEDPKITVTPTNDEKKHVDYNHTVVDGAVEMEFYWKANVITTVNLLEEWLAWGTAPDVLVMDASAHQAKWARNFEEFQTEVPLLADAVARYNATFGPTKPMFWLISPPFRENFTREPTENDMVKWMYSLKKFNAVLRTAGYLAPEGPVIPIDLWSIAEGCMDWCYRDGTHVAETINTLLWSAITGAYQWILKTKG